MSTSPVPPPPVRPTLASFWHDLPREGRLLLSIVVLEFFGTGLVLPFNVVYLHEVRGFPLSDVGLLLALPPLLGFLIVGPGGAAIDRIGARRIVLGCLAGVILADVILALAASEAVAALALTVDGLAAGMSWPASQSLIAAVVPSDTRQRYFGVNFTLLNLGIGVGGIAGGFLVDVHHLWTFQAIYLGDAVSFLPGLFLLLGPLRHVAGAPEPHDDGSAAPSSYHTVLRQPGVATVMLLCFVSSFVGYSQLNAGFVAFARAVSEASTRAIGLSFAANTLVIVLLQLVVLQRIEGRRRTRVIVVMSLVWALSWLCLGLSGLVPGTLGASFLVAACAGVFAFGETMLQPTIPALVNDLAPDHLRGRYNAASAGAFQLAAIIAPPIAGVLIAHSLGNAYVATLIVGCVLVGVLAVVRLEPQLDPVVNGLKPSPSAGDGGAEPGERVADQLR